MAAQDLPYAKKTVKTLTSKKYWGRGYTKNGMANAADFIENEMKSFGLSPLSEVGYKQYFSFPVNTFPSKMELKINGKKLNPGKDFIVHQASKGIKTSDSLIRKDSLTYISKKGNVAVSLAPKLTWSVSQKVLDYTLIEINNKTVPFQLSNFEVNIENEFVTNFTAANVMAMVKGTTKPDSIIVFTAHYDHLGGMGNKTYFPGANDNASGVAMLLNLAKYYAANPPKYSIVFIAFAAEEIGLLGSKYFTENPLFPLKNIRFLWNLDLLGNGDEGATIVNATIHPKAFEVLNKINDQQKYLPKINPRGKAANSDHYFFSEKGVPAFFLYTQGGITAYHDVYDIAKTLPFTSYENLFRLFLDFNLELMN
ncbi:M28 family metallopeptidase [Pedobacter helvus]|uniref:M28 family metallopeptidase n=1 Tax=Pedobacter helvus TaxID=2563444 RepID=A0ABW9JJ04_9SPHI|nr:M20/M25/M40 family metallo-hydrolase [Pedobacter ureilyticus]